MLHAGTVIKIGWREQLDRAAAVENIRRIAPQARLIQLSARSGEGMDKWYDFLREHLTA